MTTRLRNRIHFLLDVGITYTDISEITGPDERTIRDVRDQRDAKGGKAPEWCDQCAAERIMGLECVSSGFVGLDNWQHGKRKKMRGIFGDVVSRIPIDLFMSVKKVCLVEELSAYFSRHPEVRVIVIDMDMGFRSVIQKTFPWLIIVVDHYHVKQALEKRVSRICDILAETTGREMVTAPREISKTPNLFEQDDVSQVLTPKQGMSKQQKKVASNLRKYRKVFMKRPEKKDERDQNVILACAATYPLLAKVLERRDDFYRIWTTATSSKDAQSKFDEWARSLSERRDPLDETSGSADQAPGQLAELFRSFVAMVQRWRQEIFAFFDFAERPTNAFMESMVKEVKMWNRAGRYVSYPVLRQRFRHHIPKNSTHKRIPVGISTPAHGDETP